jgi:hypothetical protein
MVTALGRGRTETPERWQAALQRAADHALDLFEVAGQPGVFAVTSSRDAGLVYLATATSCGCEAALSGDAVCQHRATVRAALGLLPDVVENFPQRGETAASIDCPVCGGKGFDYAETHGGAGWPDRIACRRCDGSGRVTVAIVRRVEPAAAMAAD